VTPAAPGPRPEPRCGRSCGGASSRTGSPAWSTPAGVARDLAEAGHEIVAVVVAAADGPAAVRRAAAARPEVVLMDLQLPVGSGVDATRQIL
jgi:CheY-like chemotaxis protein